MAAAVEQVIQDDVYVYPSQPNRAGENLLLDLGAASQEG